MSGRSRIHRDSYYDRRGLSPDRAYGRAPPLLEPQPPPASLLDDLQMQHDEIRRLLSDNRRLANDRVVLEQELDAAKEDLHRMKLVISDIRAEHELQSREFVEKRHKFEVEARAMESYMKEAAQLRSEVEKVNDLKLELSREVQTLRKEMSKLQAENKQIPGFREDIKNLKQDLMHARNVIEYEKKEKFELMEQRQSMERNMVSLAREVEKLRAELTTVDSRPWGFGGSYGMNFNGANEALPSSYEQRYAFMGSADRNPFQSHGSGSQKKPRLDHN